MADERSNPDATQHLDDGSLEAKLTAGQRVFGRYVLEVELGRGGMGVVWRALDETLKETVALKFLPNYVARDAVALDELKQETRRARRLTHPNIVRVHEFMEAGGLAAVSMECIEGATLTQRRLDQPGRIFSIAALTPLAEQLCAALEYAHRTAKTAHRDLKPANVLITREGIVKLTDFGIARSLTETRTRLTMPGKGGVSGTLPYMSPQQLRGDKPQATDDIYALGATLYELLAGKPPFHRGDLATLMLQIRQRPPLTIEAMRAELEVVAEAVPAKWGDTIMACLAKDAEARPQSAAEVAARLGLAGTTMEVPTGKSAARPARLDDQSTGQAGKRQWAPGAVAILAVMGLAAWWTLRKGEASDRPAPAAAPVQAAKASLPTSAKQSGPLVEPTTPAPVSVPAKAREYVVTVLPAEAEARLWLGPFSEIAVRAGRAVLPNLPDGEHELVVQATGYEPFTKQVSVQGGRGESEVQLVRVKASLEISARAGTRVQATAASGEKFTVGTIGANGVLVANGVLAIGNYRVRLEHEDCEPLEGDGVEIAVGRVARFAPTQTPLPGELRVMSTPAGAEVRVNGMVVGRTHLLLPKLASEQALRVELVLVGYHRAERNVRLQAREQRELNFGALEPETGSIALHFTAGRFPVAEAEVRVDGKNIAAKKIGDGWALENVLGGVRMVEVVHRDYELWRQSVEVLDRQNVSVAVTPEAKPAVVNLEVRGPTSYAVLIDGVRKEIVKGSITLPAAEHVIVEVRADGFRPAIGRLAVEANARKSMPITLEPQPLPKAGLPHENSLHMKFVPVPGAGALFSIWETRIMEFEIYLFATKQKSRLPAGEPTMDAPAVAMTWAEAKAFCQWLTDVERAEGNLGSAQRYRLPTDAEWSLAVGLGRETGKTPADKNGKVREVYPWGKQWPPLAGAGNYAGEEAGLLAPQIAGYKDAYEKAAPVGRFSPNVFGIFDLGGNVWEWCEDEFQPGSGERVGRGGSYRDFNPTLLLSSARGHTVPTSVSQNVGFRCVLEVVAEK